MRGERRACLRHRTDARGVPDGDGGHHDNDLVRMRRRAASLGSCMTGWKREGATLRRGDAVHRAPSWEQKRLLGHVLDDAGLKVVRASGHDVYGQIWACPSHRLAFVHVFKAGGTTIDRALEMLCPEGRYVCPASWCTRELRAPDNKTVAEAYTFFSFVRDPTTRFASGVRECALRGPDACGNCRAVYRAVRADDDSKPAALTPAAAANNILRKCVLSHRGCEQHVDLQTSFLVQEYSNRLRMLPITYLGRLERIDVELPALVREFFGASAASEIRRRLLTGALHERWHGDDIAEEHGRLLGPRRCSDAHTLRPEDVPEFTLAVSNLTCPSTVHLLREAYGLDYQCLRYAPPTAARHAGCVNSSSGLFQLPEPPIGTVTK